MIDGIITGVDFGQADGDCTVAIATIESPVPNHFEIIHVEVIR